MRKRVLFERRLERIAPPRAGENRLCDIGCAGGQFMALAADRGWSCTGVELNPPAAARSRALGFEVVEGALEHLSNVPWGTFDLVTCWDCIEHTPEPGVFADRLVELLKPGGTLLLTTLNVRSVAFRVLGTRWSMVQEDHFTYWNAASLKRLFCARGCQVTEVKTFGLGRDFVRWLDVVSRTASVVRSRVRPAGGRGEAAFTGTSTWDVNPIVLGAERLMNGLLAATSSGVDIGCVVRRRATTGASRESRGSSLQS